MRIWFALATLAALVFAGAAQAQSVHVAVGAYGGLTVPILQDVDASSFSPGDAFGDTGSKFGLRVPVKAIPIVTLEPYFAKSSYSEQTETFNGIEYTREGWDATAYGVNVALGDILRQRFMFYPYLGLGSTKLERTGEEIKKVTWNFGLGLGFPLVKKLSVHVRSEFDMVVTDDTSRKFGDLTVAVHYNVYPRR
jgi:Outer membrane protein beta-barrel domain